MVKPVIITGVGRSGTTWLAEMLNSTGEFNYLFEPLHPHYKLFDNYHWAKYYPVDGGDYKDLVTFHKYIYDEVIEGHPWTTQFMSEYKRGKSRLIKFIRANLLLPWLVNNTPARDAKFIHIIRHPFSVINSQLNYNWERNLFSTWILNQSKLMEDYLLPYKYLLEQYDDCYNPFYEFMLYWCILNYVPLRSLLPEDDVHIVFYEDLISNPLVELKKIWNYIEYNGILPNDDIINKPSKLSSNPVVNKVGDYEWSSAIDIKWALNILHVFGLDIFYGMNSMPLFDRTKHPLEVLL